MRKFPPDLDEETLREAIWGTGPSARRAFERLLEHHEPRVESGVAKMAAIMGHTHVVDEIRQDVWRRLLDKNRQLLRVFKPEKGPFGPFIYMLAKQQAWRAIMIEHKQSLAALEQVSGVERLLDDSMFLYAASLIQSDVLAKILARAANELDELDRTILREVHLKEKKATALAKELGVSAEMIWARKSRMKKKLARWAKELFDEDPLPPDPLISVAVFAVMLMGMGAFDNPTVETDPIESRWPDAPIDPFEV